MKFEFFYRSVSLNYDATLKSSTWQQPSSLLHLSKYIVSNIYDSFAAIVFSVMMTPVRVIVISNLSHTIIHLNPCIYIHNLGLHFRDIEQIISWRNTYIIYFTKLFEMLVICKLWYWKKTTKIAALIPMLYMTNMAAIGFAACNTRGPIKLPPVCHSNNRPFHQII